MSGIRVVDESPDDGEFWSTRGPTADPDPYPSAVRFRDRRVSSWWSAPVFALIVLFGVPFVLNVAPPWHQPWWPGVAAVRTLPDACAVFAGARAAALDVSGRRRAVNSPSHHECEYTVPKGGLTAILERRHAFWKSGSVAASERLDEIAGQLNGSLDAVLGAARDALAGLDVR